MALSAPIPQQPTVPPPPTPTLAPQGQKPAKKSATPTFLGAEPASMQGGGTGKTLLGQ